MPNFKSFFRLPTPVFNFWSLVLIVVGLFVGKTTTHFLPPHYGIKTVHFYETQIREKKKELVDKRLATGKWRVWKFQIIDTNIPDYGDLHMYTLRKIKK